MAANPLVQLGFSMLLGVLVAVLGNRAPLRLVVVAFGTAIVAGGAPLWI